MLVRVLLLATHLSRPRGHYLVDDVEAREMQATGAELDPAIEAVVPQVGVDDDDAVEGAAALAADMFPPAGVDLDNTSPDVVTPNTDEVQS